MLTIRLAKFPVASEKTHAMLPSGDMRGHGMNHTGQLHRLAIIALCAGLVAACGDHIYDFEPPYVSLAVTPPGVPGAPKDANKQELSTQAQVFMRIEELGSRYLATAATYANERQAFDLPIIGAAAASAAALTFGWSTDWIKIAGISAGSLYALHTYYKVDERIGILLNGVNAADCIRSLASTAVTLKAWDRSEDELLRGLRRIQTAVRQKSLRQADSVTFAEMAQLITAQSKAAALSEAAFVKTNNASPPESEKFVNELPVKVTACVAEAK